MFFSRAFLVITCILACVALANGHHDGAPESCCDTMTVDHDNDGGAQNHSSNYMIMTDVSEVKTGETVEVNIMSNDGTAYFEGLLLKAIDASQSEDDYSGVSGCFVIADADVGRFQYLNCSNVTQSAITHCSPDNKTEATFTWQAPSTPGSYVFVLTLVQDHDVYWQPFRSDPITVSAGFIGHANKLAIFAFALLAIAKYL